MHHSAEKNDTAYQLARARMVHDQLQRRGIIDQAVLEAMGTVPRERFVMEPYRKWAYEDGPIPTLARQTISQPYIIALMFSMLRLRPTDRVLEIGTGSGYAAAVLSHIVAEVYTIERHSKLVTFARARFQDGNYRNIRVKHGDGTLGWPEMAPFDAIVAAASGPHVPEPLKQQLAVGGRLLLPVGGNRYSQHLVLLTRTGKATFEVQQETPVAFVPLIGAEGWPVEKDEG